MKIQKLNEEYTKGEWVEVNLNTKKNGTPNIIPVKVDKELYHGKSFLGWAWGERQHEYPMSAIVNRIDGDDTTEIIRRYSLTEDINVENIGDYIVDHYDFDDIDDKYSCINSIRDSFKDEKTISKEELEQFIGSHNGRDKVNESKSITESKRDMSEDELIAYIRKHPELDEDDLDDLNCSGMFDIPDSFCDDPYNVTEDEAFEYFDYILKKANESKSINENKSVTSEFDNLITPVKYKYPEVDFIINAHTKLGCEIVADSNQERDITEDEIIKITTGTKFKYIQSADRLNKSRGHRAYVNIIFDFDDTSLTESRATHCVYFNQDGWDQIEFEGTEDECNRYISAIQVEQDDEFGDEAPERFIRRLTEASYGGAFDIRDDQYFTREDIENAAEEVLNHINETFTEQYELGGTWFEDGKWIVNINSIDGEWEIEELLPIDMRKIKEPWHLKREYAFDMASKFIDKIKLETQPITESLNEDTDTVAVEGPKEGPEAGLSSLINEAIQDELKTIDIYNSLAITARSEGYEDIAKMIDEINTEENKHVGQLQEALKSISPNAIAIEDGTAEGQEQLSNAVMFDDDLNDDELGIALFKLR